MKKISSLLIPALKLFRSIFLVNPTYYLSGYFKRRPNIWIIGSKSNFSDNSKYFYIFYSDYLKEKHNIDLVWISRSKKTTSFIKSLGIGKCKYAYSLSGIYTLLIAKVYMYSYGFVSDLPFFLSKRSFRVCLWHGIGIKNNIGYIGETYKIKKKLTGSLFLHLYPFLRYAYPAIFVKPDLMLSTSPHMTKHFSDCFKISKEKCIISSYPRCEIFQVGQDKVLNFIEKYEPIESYNLLSKIKKYSKTIIYMPTWRENNPDFLADLDFDWHQLDHHLVSKGTLLLIKAHPLTCSPKLTKMSNIMLLDKEIDIYPILAFVSTLITDYSSIYFDFLLLKKEIALFPFDYENYVRNSGEFSYDYNIHMPGLRVDNFSDFLKIIDGEKLASAEDMDAASRICDLYWEKEKDSIGLIQEIIKRLMQ